MKKLLFTVLFNFTLFANTNTCMLDIYFGNGVWNSYKEAEASKNELRTFMQNHNPSRFAIEDEDLTYSLKNAYNHTYGTSIDLIETHWQLYESGQISEGYFSFVAHVLDGSVTQEKFLKDLREIIAQSDADTSNMYAKYQAESFNLKHNVLLVSHSQGNLFANKIFAQLSNSEKQHFQNVAIATPASRVFSGGPYVTLNQDAVVGAIPGSLPGNAEGFGHTFVDSYLNNPNSATKEKIAVGINEAVDMLDLIGCGRYIGFQFIGYVCDDHHAPIENDVDIYGAYYTGVQSWWTTEKIILEHQTEGEWIDNICQVNGFDVGVIMPEYDKQGCEAYMITSFYGEVTSGTFNNSLTCATYAISSETVKKLNNMLTSP